MHGAILEVPKPADTDALATDVLERRSRTWRVLRADRCRCDSAKRQARVADPVLGVHLDAERRGRGADVHLAAL